MSDVDPDDLEIGDTFQLPDGPRLVIVGVTPASEAPDAAADDGPLYESRLEGGPFDGSPKRLLYRPHNIDVGTDAGAEYVGQTDVDEPAEPFWCDGCDYPHLGGSRHDLALTDADVCSYGCGQTVEADRRKARIEGEHR